MPQADNEERARELLALSITHVTRKQHGAAFFMILAIASLGTGLLGFIALIAYIWRLL